MAKRGEAGLTAAEFRRILDETLRELDEDAGAGPLLRAAALSVRLEITDLDLAVRICASDEPGRHLAWDFADDGPAKLVLRMDSRTADGYLQGTESLPVAIARGRVRCAGDVRAALASLPALRLLAEPYRRLVRRLHPTLPAT